MHHKEVLYTHHGVVLLSDSWCIDVDTLDENVCTIEGSVTLDIVGKISKPVVTYDPLNGKLLSPFYSGIHYLAMVPARTHRSGEQFQVYTGL